MTNAMSKDAGPLPIQKRTLRWSLSMYVVCMYVSYVHTLTEAIHTYAIRCVPTYIHT